MHDDPTAGHLDVAKTIARIARLYCWPGMYREIARYVRSCQNCLAQSTATKARREPARYTRHRPLATGVHRSDWTLATIHSRSYLVPDRARSFQQVGGNGSFTMGYRHEPSNGGNTPHHLPTWMPGPAHLGQRYPIYLTPIPRSVIFVRYQTPDLARLHSTLQSRGEGK